MESSGFANTKLGTFQTQCGIHQICKYQIGQLSNTVWNPPDLQIPNWATFGRSVESARFANTKLGDVRTQCGIRRICKYQIGRRSEAVWNPTDLQIPNWVTFGHSVESDGFANTKLGDVRRQCGIRWICKYQVW